MVLRVSTEREDGCLLLYCGDVATYRGPLRWSGCDFDLRAESDPATGDAVYQVLDQAVGFELRCGVIEPKPMRSKYPD